MLNNFFTKKLKNLGFIPFIIVASSNIMVLPASAGDFITTKVTTSTNVIKGAYAEWKNPSPPYNVTGSECTGSTDPGDSGPFLAQLIFITLPNYRAVEAGLTKGWQGDCSKLTFYYAEYIPNGPVSEFTEYLIYTPVGSPGTNHAYTIFWDDYYTSWDIKIDSTIVGQSFQPSDYFSKTVDIGGEVGLSPQDKAGSYLSPTYPTYMQIFKTNGYWYFWKDAGGSISWPGDGVRPAIPPYVWQWLDPGTYRYGKNYQNQ